MMRVCIFIIILFVLCYDQILYANAISVEISQNLLENEAGLPGDNGTQLKCSSTEENIVQIFSVSLMALNWSSITFETIAVYIPDQIPSLTLKGQYLKGRVTLTTITQSSMKAVMEFNQLMCIDDTIYKCQVIHLDSGNVIQNPISNIISISVQAVIVVGTVCGSILLILVIVFGVIKNKTFRCLLMRNRNDRSADYVNTTQQQNPSFYEGVDQALDVHNYEQLSRMEHLYNNTNLSHN